MSFEYNFIGLFTMVVQRGVSEEMQQKFLSSADSWYRQLIESQYFEKENFSKITVDNSTPSFAEKIKFVFSLDYFTRKYLKDLKFGNKWIRRSINGLSTEEKRSTVISSARFCVRLLAVDDNFQLRATMFLRHLAAKSPFKVEIYNEFFEYADQVDSIVPSIFTSLGIGTFAVVVTSLLFIPQPSCALWVCVTILSINLGTVGCMTLWNVRLDFVSMVTIVMSIGTSVDFAAHIAYHFARSHLQTAEARLRDTISFAKTATLVITFGLIHGVIILPVLLATFHIERSPCCMKIIVPSTDDSATTREKTHCKKCLALGAT
uniref:Patched domain-containing protein 3 n=1 Tax=Romanomermis culicivorax TaxID=13658 RepID=A0A915KYW6_ROMCU